MDETFTKARTLLAGLISGDVDREKVAGWAMEKYLDESAEYFTNDSLWTLLYRLTGADSMTSPGSYLYLVEDFEACLDDADASI